MKYPDSLYTALVYLVRCVEAGERISWGHSALVQLSHDRAYDPPGFEVDTAGQQHAKNRRQRLMSLIKRQRLSWQGEKLVSLTPVSVIFMKPIEGTTHCLKLK